MRRLWIIGFLGTLSLSVFPCSMVTIGGAHVLVVHQVAGTIVGNGRISLMGTSHDRERIANPVSGAVISLEPRNDLKIIRGHKGAQSKLMDWKCGLPFATTTSDDQGKFEIPASAGKYCLQIIGPSPKAPGEVQMRSTFIFDVASDAANRAIVANITPTWPDCSGGSSIRLVP